MAVWRIITEDEPIYITVAPAWGEWDYYPEEEGDVVLTDLILEFEEAVCEPQDGTICELCGQLVQED